jgi:hypothetical protein
MMEQARVAIRPAADMMFPGALGTDITAAMAAA